MAPNSQNIFCYVLDLVFTTIDAALKVMTFNPCFEGIVIIISYERMQVYLGSTSSKIDIFCVIYHMFASL